MRIRHLKAYVRKRLEEVERVISMYRGREIDSYTYNMLIGYVYAYNVLKELLELMDELEQTEKD